MISGGEGTLLAVGLIAAALATWISIHLFPPGALRMRPLAGATLAVHVLRQSIVGGMDVARRAFDPMLSLRSGLVVCPLHLPFGPARSAFCALSSLQPGALPAGTDPNGMLVVHCLDVEQSVAANMAAEEALFARALSYD